VTLPLTRETLAAAYDYLCTTQPFNKWNLPSSEDIVFRVTRHKDRFAHYTRDVRRHEIVVSAHYIRRTDSLMMTMAHEMIHLHQAESGMENSAQHNAAFRALAEKVCAIHGFDPGLF
jgi:hypothetical protein